MDPRSIIFQVFQSLVVEGLNEVVIERDPASYLGDYLHTLDYSDPADADQDVAEEEE